MKRILVIREGGEGWPIDSVFKIQMSFESIQIQIQIQIPTFELAKFRFIESEFVELIQNRPIQIQS